MLCYRLIQLGNDQPEADREKNTVTLPDSKGGLTDRDINSQ
jgi:hypothetical protein